MPTSILNAAQTNLIDIGSSLEGMAGFLESWHQIALGILGNQDLNSREDTAAVNNQLHVLLESIQRKAEQLDSLSAEVCAISSELRNAQA